MKRRTFFAALAGLSAGLGLTKKSIEPKIVPLKTGTGPQTLRIYNSPEGRYVSMRHDVPSGFLTVKDASGKEIKLPVFS